MDGKEIGKGSGYKSSELESLKEDETLAIGGKEIQNGKKQRKFHWGEEEQQAFDQLKARLTSAPVLAYADPQKPFILNTDASTEGLGAVLYQHQDGRDRVIAYASRGLNQAERRYPAHKLEFLALKWAVTDKFHDYLYDANFVVRTDNNPLTYVLTTAKLDAAGHRWVAQLANYNFSLEYRAGRLNRDADALSRINWGSANTTPAPVVAALLQGKCCSPPLAETMYLGQLVTEQDIDGSATSNQPDWKAEQRADPELLEVISHLQNPTSKVTRTLDPSQKANWKAHAAALAHAYNCTKHDTTGYSPYFLMFGRHPRLPVDLQFGTQPRNPRDHKSYSEYGKALSERLRAAFETVRRHTSAAQQTQKQHYDRRVRGSTVQKGDRVLVRNVTPQGKLDDRWSEEVYLVISQPSEEVPVYQLQGSLNFQVPKNESTSVQPEPPTDPQVLPELKPQPAQVPKTESSGVCPEWQNNKQHAQVVDVVVDPYLSTHLRPHQREGVTFLYECVMGLRNYGGSGAILADDMGLGKTLQCITLIWTLMKQGPYGGKPAVKRVLVITPGSLVKNWSQEFRKWLGPERLQVFVVAGDKRVEDYLKTAVYPVMIISYEMFVRGYEVVKQVPFDLVLIMSLNTRRRIVLSGTPIQNDLQEFFSVVDFCNPGVLVELVLFCRPSPRQTQVYREILRSSVTLDLLQQFCKDSEYSWLRLDGQTPTSQRQALVTRFNSAYGQEKIFLLSSKAGGVGLNLIGASRLFLFDIDWNPANDLQGSIEEKVYQRQISKQGLSGAVIDFKASDIQFSQEDLKDLFSFSEDSECFKTKM
nr:hypothetical protein BaRGS_003629 [Batillaria attramentaria]